MKRETGKGVVAEPKAIENINTMIEAGYIGSVFSIVDHEGAENVSTLIMASL